MIIKINDRSFDKLESRINDIKPAAGCCTCTCWCSIVSATENEDKEF